MKRSKYSKTGNIINILYYNTRRLISLPFRLIRLPFKLILGPVFNSNRKPNKTVLTVIFNKLRKLNEQVDQNRTRYNLVMVHNGQISQLESDVNFLSRKLKELITKNNHRVMTLNPDTVTAKLDKLKEDVKQLKQEETDLGQIEAEKLGMQVAVEEKEQSRDEKYDWKREQRLVDNKISNAE